MRVPRGAVDHWTRDQPLQSQLFTSLVSSLTVYLIKMKFTYEPPLFPMSKHSKACLNFFFKYPPQLKYIVTFNTHNNKYKCQEHVNE